jgi:hypothetical protein
MDVQGSEPSGALSESGGFAPLQRELTGEEMELEGLDSLRRIREKAVKGSGTKYPALSEARRDKR